MDWEVSVETLCEKERKPLKLRFVCFGCVCLWIEEPLFLCVC